MVIEDLLDAPECPKCDEEGEHTDQYYHRCKNDSCDVLTWVENNYSQSLE